MHNDVQVVGCTSRVRGDIFALLFLLFFHVAKQVKENAATPSCCEAPEMFVTMKLHVTFHRHEGEQVMVEFHL